jgi:hypothetical protein
MTNEQEPESEYEKFKRLQKEQKKAKKTKHRPDARKWLNDLRHGHNSDDEDYQSFERFNK